MSTLTLGVDHLSPSLKEKYPNLKFGNHDKNVAFELLENPGSIKCSDINSQAARKEFYKKIVGAIQSIVDVIYMDVVREIQKSGFPTTPDVILEKVVSSSLPKLPILYQK